MVAIGASLQPDTANQKEIMQLTQQAAACFNAKIGDLQGLPFVLLHDRIDPNPLVDEALTEAAALLEQKIPTDGHQWFALLNAVIDQYDEDWADSELVDEVSHLY